MRPSGSGKELERRRFRAIAMLREGLSAADVASRVGAHVVSVYRWAAMRRRGVKAMRSRPTPGRPPKLTAEQKRELERILLEGAKAQGFPTDLWTCPRIAEVIRREFAVDYHVDHVVRLLHGLGWSPQKPQRRAVERDEKAIRSWIKRDWPRIKKKRND